MKTNKSTAACAEYNTRNALAIEQGILASWEPDDQMLAEEVRAAAREKAQFEEAVTTRAILEKLDPKTDGRYCQGVRVEISEVRSSGSWHTHQVGWKMTIGDGYGRDANKTWLTIGDGKLLGINAKQLAKAQAKLAEVKAVNDRKAAARNAVQTAAQRTNAFIAANPEFCKLVGHSSFNDGETLYYGSGYNRRASYQTAFIFTPEGQVRIGGETFSVEQWTEVYNLRNAQAEAMKALKESFKAAPVAA